MTVQPERARIRPRLSHFATHHGRITHYSPIGTALFLQPDTQDNRVVPEPDTVGKAVTIHLADSGQTGLQNFADLPFQGLATRKPMLLFSLVGLLLFRFDDDKLLELLFQLPPRTPRADELNRPGYPHCSLL